VASAVFFYWIWVMVVVVCGAADRGERGNAGADSGGPAEGAGSQQQVHRAPDRQQVTAGVRK